MHDVIVIGGGVIGLSLAYELAGQGVSSAVLDQGALGQEASWAGAGILPPGNPARARTPEARLRAGSHVLWPAWSARLGEETGIDNGFVRAGGLEVRCNGPAGELDDELLTWRDEGVAVEPLSGDGAFRSEPALSRRVTSAFRLPETGQVRNPRHVKALIGACVRRGVSLLPGTSVYRIGRCDEKVLAIETSLGRMSAGQFVIAAGAWSGNLLAPFGFQMHVRPVRGQIVLLNAQPCLIRQVIHVGRRYLVPRADGRILVGSTEEDVGFDKRTTAEAVGDLVNFAITVVPELAQAAFERSWSGLRPQSSDGLPCLGAVPETANLFVATGHFRSGLQMSPVTAAVMTQLLLGRSASVPLEPYAIDRQAPRSESSGTQLPEAAQRGA